MKCGGLAMSFVLAPALALVVACQPDLSKTSSNPTFAANNESTPMVLDPTQPVPVEGWWHNGTQLLHLADDGSYRLWNGTNRFDKPLQTGRWSRTTYIAVELEAYATRVPERTRCELESAGSEIRFVIPGVDPMVRFERPPPTAEDRLVGVWRGAGGMLRLGSDGRYRADAPSSSASAPISLAGHSGHWLVEGTNLLLLPDSPTVPSVTLAVEPVGTDDVRLRAGDGTYARSATP